MSAMLPHRAASLYEIDRGMRLQAELATDALLARVSQPDPVQMCAEDDAEAEPLFTPFEAAMLVIVGLAAIALFAASCAGALA